LYLKSASKIAQFKKKEPTSYMKIIAIIVNIELTHDENKFLTIQL
jgi:hypothetical protein